MTTALQLMMDAQDSVAVGTRLDRRVRATPRGPGLLETLLHAAQLLEGEAAILKRSYTVRGRWHHTAEPTAKATHDELRGAAARLRKAHKYMVPNPLGGPAKVFDACADAIRAGDPINAAMANFGLAWRSNVKVSG